MNVLKLCKPCPSLRESFKSYYKDYLPDEGDHAQIYREMYKYGYDDFDSYLKFLEDRENGIGVPEGWTATHTFWLINESEEILGIVRIRPDISTEFLSKYIGHIGYDIKPTARGRGYGKSILQLALKEAAALDIKKALLLCSAQNDASRRIIIQNGGVYESDIADESGDIYERYWIEINQ